MAKSPESQSESSIVGDNDENTNSTTSNNPSQEMFDNAEIAIKELRYSDAYTLITECLKLTPDNSKFLSLAGTITFYQALYEEALNYHKSALDQYITIPNKDPIVFANKYDNIGRVYLYTGYYDDALEYYDKALEVTSKADPLSHIELTYRNYYLSYIWLRKGDLKKAISYIQKADAAYRNRPDPHKNALACITNMYGRIAYRQHNFQEALDYFSRSFDLFNIHYTNKPHPSISTMRMRQAQALLALDEYERAMKYQTEALDNDIEVFGKNHPTIARDRRIIGEYYYVIKDHAIALDQFNTSLKIYEKSYSPTHPHIIKVKRLIDYTNKAIAAPDNAAPYLEIIENLYNMPIDERGYTKMIFESDGPTRHDALGYNNLAEGIAEFVKDNKTHLPLCLAVDAPWGQGKSSLMYMLREELDQGQQDVEKEYIKAKGLEQKLYQNFQTLLLGFKWPFLFTCLVMAYLAIKFTSVHFYWGAPLLSFIIAFGHNKFKEFKAARRSSDDHQYETVFINAWRHGHGDKLTASIVHQVIKNLSARHGPGFMMQLHLSRFNELTLMTDVINNILRSWFLILLGLLIFIFPLETQMIDPDKIGNAVGSLGLDGKELIGSSLSITGLLFKILGKPSTIKISQYFTSPNYEEIMGVDQEIEEDFKRVLHLLDKRNKKLALFIDDLDRCNPETVHKVVEALNVFFGTEENKCLFILGMHREMVANALEVAYKDISKNINENFLLAEQRPYGRRFLEKIVQFVIHLPIPGDDEIKEYLEKLSADKSRIGVEETIKKRKQSKQLENLSKLKRKWHNIQSMIRKIYNSFIGRKHTEASMTIEERQIDLAKQLENGADDERIIEHELQEIVKAQQLVNAKSFDKDSKENITAFRKVRGVLKNNPRQFKRFVNHLRFKKFIGLNEELDTSPTYDAFYAAMALEFPTITYWIRKKGVTLSLVQDAIELLKNAPNNEKKEEKKEEEKVSGHYNNSIHPQLISEIKNILAEDNRLLDLMELAPTVIEEDNQRKENNQ